MKHSPELAAKHPGPRGDRRIASIVKNRKLVHELGGAAAVRHILQELADALLPS